MSEAAILSWMSKELAEFTDDMGNEIMLIPDAKTRERLIGVMDRFTTTMREGVDTFLGTETIR